MNIQHKRLNAKDNGFLPLNAEKAFDRIEWGYFCEILKRFGFGEGYFNWLELLYTDPMAEIITNNQVSKPINLGRGTRQGCPMSPLLFLLAIEPLAMTIWKSSEIRGKKNWWEGTSHIFVRGWDSFYLRTNLTNSAQALNHIVGAFGEFSGYKINNNKSALLLLNDEERKSSLTHIQFAKAPTGFTYLGNLITPDAKDIVSTNYDPLVQEAVESLDRWNTMPISMIGCINIIKLSILPKFLYFFQTVLLPLPVTFFSSLRKTFTWFIWNNKCPRLRLSLLYLPNDRGGLKLPNMRL